MKRNSVLLFTALVLFVLQSPKLTQARWQPEPGHVFQGKEFKKTVEFEPGGDFTLKTDKGSVVVISWDQNRIEINAKR
jgi:hypothetical protein